MIFDRRALLGAAAALCLPAAGRAGPAQKVHVVRMAKMAFGAVPTTLSVGDAIEWVNDDIFQHTATARNGFFDVVLKPGAKVRTVLKSAGEIPFYCRYHPGMTGTLRVGA